MPRWSNVKSLIPFFWQSDDFLPVPGVFASSTEYALRHPQKTTLYKVVDSELDTFLRRFPKVISPIILENYLVVTGGRQWLLMFKRELRIDELRIDQIHSRFVIFWQP